MKEVLVLYYSHGGAVGEMATFIARGIESIPGVKDNIYRSGFGRQHP
jgi:NAD(P)H dehydrogenase (quinone)